MKKKEALIVVDVQNDFCPGGSLAVPEGDKIVSVINELLPKFDLIIFTKDWHDPEMDAFSSQHEGTKPFDKYINKKGRTDTLWPDHCVVNTPGAEFHPNLNLGKCAKDFYIFKKGMDKNYHPYSGFGGTELNEFLKKRKVTNVYMCGLALDYCVKDTAVDSAMYGFKTAVIEDACKPIDPNINETLRIFKECGIAFIESFELDVYSVFGE